MPSPVQTRPAGGRLSLDGQELGTAPLAVSLPTDGGAHELCAAVEQRRVCRSVTAQSLGAQDPYLFEVD